MFETLELQYLNELSEGEVRDFPSPEAFHTLKVEHLGRDAVKPSAKVGGKFPMPVSALVGNFTVKSGKFSDGTPPIARTFLLATHSFIECSEFIQGLLQGLRMLYLLTGIERQIGIQSKSAPTLSPVAGKTSLDALSVTTDSQYVPTRSRRIWI